MASVDFVKIILGLTNVFEKLKIPYVIVGGFSVMILGRIRTTLDLDVLIKHQGIDRIALTKELNEVGFDLNINDLKTLDEELHVTFFFSQNMFRIDLKGNYSPDVTTSIDEAISIELEGKDVKIDLPENLIINKLIFGSETDYEDAIAVMSKCEKEIDINRLTMKAEERNITKILEKFIDEFHKLK